MAKDVVRGGVRQVAELTAVGNGEGQILVRSGRR